MSKVTQAPATLVKSETVINKPGLRVVLLDLPPGEGLPTHAAPRDVVVVVIEGSGTVSVEGRAISVVPGSVVELAPGQQHAVHADERLRIIVVQALIEGGDQPAREPAAVVMPPPS